MAASSEPQPEFSRLVPVDRLGAAEIPEEIPEEISAEPGERAALARRFGLLSLDRLSAIANCWASASPRSMPCGPTGSGGSSASGSTITSRAPSAAP